MLKKRLIAWLLMFALCFYSMPVYAFAQEASDAAGDDTSISENVDATPSDTEASDSETSGAEASDDVTDESDNAETGAPDSEDSDTDEGATEGTDDNGQTAPDEGNAGEDESVGVTPDEGENTDEVIGDENNNSEPAEPADPEQSAGPETLEPTEPEQPAEPTEPADPTEPEQPAEPTEPEMPETPAEPEQPTEPVTPEEPTEPEQPTQPVEPQEPVVTPEEPVVPEEPKDIPIEQVPVLPEVNVITDNLQQVMAVMPVPVLLEEDCTCEYMCTWFWGKYININEACPVCSHATEEQLDPYTFDPADPESFICKGVQPIVPGKDASCTHNAVINGGSMWESWFPGGGSPNLLPASCHYPATAAEAIECMNCGAKWLWKFDETSQPNPENHYFGKNEPVIVKEADCLQDGLQTQTCLFCGDIETVIKGGHMKPEDSSKIEIVEPTCEDGYEKYTCERCGEEVIEVLQGRHTWPENADKLQRGICTECGAIAYWIFSYEDGATPSGSGYEVKLCAMVIEEADGEVYGVDKDGQRLNGDSFTLIINESLMGKVKSITNKDGVAVTTRVVGYRNMDKPDSKIYEIGEEIPYSDVPDMLIDIKDSWANYYADDMHKTIYLEAVREEVSTFKVNVVPYGETLKSDPTLRRNIAATSEGIESEVTYNDEFTTAVVTYTIPADYAADTVNINATEDVMLAYDTIEHKRFGQNGTQPGDTLGPVYIRLVNLSEKQLSYNDGSFVLQSPSYSDDEPYIEPIYTFDGSTPPAASVPSRVSNGALRYLYGVETDLMHQELSDEVLGAKLVERGYENGIADLHQYYLDYYNNTFGNVEEGKVWYSLSELPFKYLVERNEGIFGGHSSAAASVKETNPEVAGVGFSYFYTRLMSVVPGNVENLKDFDGIYAVGNYMKQAVSYNDVAKAAWGNIAPGASEQINGMSIYINGESNNFYQNTAWGFEVGFGLMLKDIPKPEPKTGSLTVSKTVTVTGADLNDADRSREFNFTVTLSDNTINGTYGDMSFENGVAKFTLKHGESKTASKLPVGVTYTVVEQATADYSTTAVGDKGTISEAGATAAFVNNRAVEKPLPKTGSLTVNKTVVVNGAEMTDADRSTEFNFTVTLSDTSINGVYGAMEFVNGVATFNLKHNESKTASNLPTGVEYTVTEREAAGYTATAAGETGTISEAGVVVAFTNTRTVTPPPTTPENPGDDNPGGDDDPELPPVPTTNIEEPPVPLTETPTEEVIFDEEVPLTGMPEEDEEILLDEEVPLAKVPKTGDNLILWFFAAVASAIGALSLGRKRD